MDTSPTVLTFAFFAATRWDLIYGGGGPGNLGLKDLGKRADAADKWLKTVRDPFQKALGALLA